jgi:hypothetical protein
MINYLISFYNSHSLFEVIHVGYLALSFLTMVIVFLMLVYEDIKYYLQKNYPKKFGYPMHNKFGYNYKSVVSLIVLCCYIPYINLIWLVVWISYFFKVQLKLWDDQYL